MMIRYVTLWSWRLTYWSWACVVDRVTCGQSMYQIWARPINPLMTYWWFTTDFSSVFRCAPIPKRLFLKTREPICAKFVGDIRSSLHWSSKMVQISYSVSKRQRLKVETSWAIRPKITHFEPPPRPVKIGKRWARCLGKKIKRHLRPNLWYTFDGRTRCWQWEPCSGKKRKKFNSKA